MKYILLLVLTFISIGCVTTPKSDISKEEIEAIVSFTPFPAEPDWVEFTRKPVVRSIVADDYKNFEVSDELVKKNLQQVDYIERVSSWKKTNKVD